MQYNWGDPKKNSLVKSRMMAKAEVTRKKRLTSIKSTLSNQLHPASENKLRKKKKAPDSARHLTCDEDKNDSHSQNADDSLDTIRKDTFPVPPLSSYPKTSMFDEFGLNAAADGLFHPASSIEAFAEHDAKYHQEIQDTSGKSHSRSQRSGSEYPPSRENHRLPSIPTGTTKRGRLLAPRPESKLQSTGKNGSAPASMTTTSSLSNLVDREDRKRSLTAAQSDTKLYAPRRLEVVPSSADQNALDFLEHELDMDNNLPYKSPIASSIQMTREVDNNEVPEDGNSIVPPLDFSLTKKFEELKQLMKTNREKGDSARQLEEQQKAASGLAPHLRSSDTRTQAKKSAIRAASGFSDTKNGLSREKNTLTKCSTLAPASMSSSSKRRGNQVSEAASRKKSSTVAIVRAPTMRSKKEMKIHRGVSLADLKAEHQEALQMLKELGGPVDPEYQLADNISKSYRVERDDTKVSGSSTLLTEETLHKQQLNHCIPTTSPMTASSSVSMVTKLRESISSGRISSRESSPRSSSYAKEATGSTTSALEASNQTLSTTDVAVLEKSQIAEVSADSAATRATLSPNPTTTDPWKQYDTDEVDEDDNEDADNNYETETSNDVKETSTTDRIGDRYSDEGFESEW